MPDYSAVSSADLDTMESFYGGLFRKVRATLGVSAFGLAVIELGPGADDHPDHDHAGGQEEVFRRPARDEAYAPAGYTELGAPDPLG